MYFNGSCKILTRSHFEMTLTTAVPGTTPGQPLGIYPQIHHDSIACRHVLLTHSGCTRLARVTTKSPVGLLSKFIEKQLCVTIALTLTVLESLNDKGTYRVLWDSLLEFRVAAPISIERWGRVSPSSRCHGPNIISVYHNLIGHS